MPTRFHRTGLGSNSEIPLLASFFYLFDEVEMAPSRESFSGWKGGCWPHYSRGWSVGTVTGVACLIRVEECQVGSLAGAAHLLNDYAGVLRLSSVRMEISCRRKG